MIYIIFRSLTRHLQRPVVTRWKVNGDCAAYLLTVACGRKASACDRVSYIIRGIMANFKTKFDSHKQDWETPDELFDPLNTEFGFTLDVCATVENAKCADYFTESDDALKRAWHGVCWMNPPFGTQGAWVRKAYQEAQSGHATVVCLLPSRTNTNWWHDYCVNGEIRFIRGRPKFKGAKHGLPQPLSIVIFRSKI